jgi:hypothetical protein
MHVTQVNNSRRPHRAGASPADPINRLRRSWRLEDSTRRHVRPFRRLTVSTVAASVAVIGFAAAGSPAAQATIKSLAPADRYCGSVYADEPITQLRPNSAEASMDCLINKARVAAGVARLSLEPYPYVVNSGGYYVITGEPPLLNSATAHATKSVQLKWWDPNDGAVSHIDPETHSDPATRIAAAGYCPHGAAVTAENTFSSSGMGQQYPPTPRGAVNWWLSDPPHRATLLNPAYREHRIGIVPGSAFPGPAYDPSGTFVEDLGSCD